MKKILLTILLILMPFSVSADELRILIQDNFRLIAKSSSKTVGDVLEKINNIGSIESVKFLEQWQNKKLYYIKQTNILTYAQKNADGTFTMIDVVNGKSGDILTKKQIKQIKPNSGVRSKIGAYLVGAHLLSGDKKLINNALKTIERKFQPQYLLLLDKARQDITDATLQSRIDQLYRFALIKYSDDKTQKINAIQSFAGDLSLQTRASLYPLLESQIKIAPNKPETPNLARIIKPNQTIKKQNGQATTNHWFSDSDVELTYQQAYELLVKQDLAPALITREQRDNAIIEHHDDPKINGIILNRLDSEEKRNTAYQELSHHGIVPPMVSDEDMRKTIDQFYFYGEYTNIKDPDIISTLIDVLDGIETKVAIYQFLDLALDGLSLTSIYFLAAIGLAITFGVMRVINMAHGEFIMMGAYTGYVVQLFVPNYTLSIAIAIPAAFLVTFMAGVVMERLVIRHLYKRPLETLLATFGISIALQQIAKNIFGTQARPLTSPAWLDGSWVVNDVLSISLIRIAIFALGIIFFVLLLFVMNKTRFGLETRAVTQNPQMAASMGINPDKINMLTFGFGSGIAGIAGVAIGLFSKVTSELGTDYIVQSFMTVVVGGVGNIWGTLTGALLIGFLQKSIEWFNPSNTLAAQTYMIIFIILFVQFRPRGIITQKGRAAGD